MRLVERLLLPLEVVLLFVRADPTAGIELSRLDICTGSDDVAFIVSSVVPVGAYSADSTLAFPPLKCTPGDSKLFGGIPWTEHTLQDRRGAEQTKGELLLAEARPGSKKDQDHNEATAKSNVEAQNHFVCLFLNSNSFTSNQPFVACSVPENLSDKAVEVDITGKWHLPSKPTRDTVPVKGKP